MFPMLTSADPDQLAARARSALSSPAAASSGQIGAVALKLRSAGQISSSADSRNGWPMKRIGVDVGGTFTDLVMRDGGGAVRIAKVPTTAANQAGGVLAAAGIVLLRRPPARLALAAGALAGLAAVAPPSRPDTAFTRPCEARCVESGSAHETCQAACACAAREVRALNLWDKMFTSGLDDAERLIVSRVAQQCLRKPVN